MEIEEQTKTTGNSRAPVAEYDARDLEVGGVVVYADRAEVKRMIRVSLKKGENDVMVNQLPSVVDPKSLRLVKLGNCILFWRVIKLASSFVPAFVEIE